MVHRLSFLTGLYSLTEFPSFLYSNKAVKRAGKVIAGQAAWSDEHEPKIREAFLISNSWRDSHAFPMRSIRYSVISHMRANGLTGITAARLKRMQAIRRKLRRIPQGLDQIQDLGGCRIILDNMQDVRILVETIKCRIKHDIRGEDDYITNPKSDGYRSHHLMLSFRGKNDAIRDTTVYDGRRIELQVRTRLQHSWATAIEAVGLFRGEELKNHIGSPDWLRFFELISAEFAQAEMCPLPANCLSRAERHKTIKELAKSLDAISVLDRVSHGVRGTDLPIVAGYKPTHYLIRYDRISNTVSVEPYSRPTSAALSYDKAEASDNQTGLETQNIVLVEVDKLDNLRAAYPNYFGDVDLFRRQLRLLIKGKSAEEFTRAPQQRVKQQPLDQGDLSWLRRSGVQRQVNFGRKMRTK